MSNPRLLVVTGNCGVGKSTLTDAWADARHGAAIHADDMHLWIRHRPTRRALNYQEAFKRDVAIVAAKRLLEQGLSVAIDNVWYPPTFAALREALADSTSAAFVRLTCDRATNRARDAARPMGRMGPRVDELGDELDRLHWPDWVTTIDTSAMRVDEALAAIDRRFEGSHPR